MDGRTVAAVALRIWGLVLFLEGVASVPGVVLAVRATLWEGDAARFNHAVQNALLCQVGATAILGLCLLIWAEAIARRVIPETAPLQLGVDASQLLTIGLALVGLVTLIHGLGEAANLAYVLATKPKWVEDGGASYLWERESATMVLAAVNVLAGALLVLGRYGLAGAWAQIRSVARTGHGLRKS